MTKQQIKEQFPDVYNEILEEGMSMCGEERGRRNEYHNNEQYMTWLRDQTAPYEEEEDEEHEE